MPDDRHTPVQLSGGAGFNFEDAIGARLFLSMLRGEAYFGAQVGVPVQVDFQVRESGWFLDDLLLTCQKSDGERARVAISAKVPRQVTATGGFNAAFADAIWAQWTAAGNGPFVPNRDLLCLASANIALSVGKAWHELQDEALALEDTPQRFLRRIAKTSKIKKALFSSLIPDSSKYPDIDDVEVVATFRALRMVQFDFNRETSVDAADAIMQCRTLLTNEVDRRAIDLWEALKSIAASQRKVGGSVNVARLVKLLTDAGFRLAHHPIFSNDWKKLHRLSEDAQGHIRTFVGNGLQLPREKARADVRQLLGRSASAVVLGPSGVGKSALLAQEFGTGPISLVWLNAPHFRYSNAAEQQTALSLEHRLAEVLASSTAADNLLVIDGIEAFSSAELGLLGQLLRDSKISQSSNWKLALSCQTHAWENVRGLLNAAFNIQPIIYELGAIDVAEVDQLLSACGITQFRGDSTAMQLFGNLKILDWVVRAISSQSTAAGLRSSSIESILDIVWRFWIGPEAQQHANAKLLQHLGVEQTSSFSRGSRISELDYPALELLPPLESRDVVRTENDTVYFAHDLIGDWIRYRALLHLDDVDEELRKRADNPIWHPAIRLYGQSLLETLEEPGASWEVIQQGVRNGTPQGDIVGDLLLDSVFFHPNAYTVLTHLRDLFLAKNTALFHRLVKRFLLVATVADPRAAALTDEDDMRLLLEAKMRLPLWSRWSAMLQFLTDNAADVAGLTSQSVPSICSLFLHHTPVTTSEGGPFPFRHEAATVALASAREVQAQELEGVWFQGKDKPFYEAALLAAADMPDAVGQFVLELSQRRPISAELKERLAAHEEKKRQEYLEHLKKAPKKKRRSVPIMPSSFRGDRLPPWPDGPSERVDDDVREAAWSGNALQPLIRARPEIAKEAILALCIEEPRYEYDNDSPLEKAGMAYWRSSLPDAYFNGPFLTFLHTNPDVGLALILDLVNFATDRWTDQGLKRNPGAEAPYLEFPINGAEIRWLGNARVYAWFRGGGGDGCPVNCALMALEFWLYEQLVAESDVSAVIETILTKSRSVAFAAVLNAVGKKHPDLFYGPLRPLLGAAGVFEQDRIVVQNNDISSMGSILWARKGETIFNLLRDWHGLEHRRLELRDIAQRLLLSSPDMQAFFTQRIRLWAKVDTNEFLCAQLDIRNYTRTEGDDGTITWKFSYPEHLERKATDGQRESQTALWLINLPYKCEQIMGEDEGIPAEQLDPFASELRSLTESTEHRDPFVQGKKPEAVLAGFCVLLRYHQDWLSQHPDFRKWGEEYLQDLITKSPAPDNADSPYAINPTSWDVWAGLCAVLLLTEDVQAAEWRTAAAASIMAPHYSITGSVLRMAFDQRSKLGDDFMRLVNLAKLWSAVDLAWGCTKHAEVLRRRRWQLAQAFLTRTIPATPLAFKRIAAASQRIQQRRRIREHTPFPSENVAAAIQRIRETPVAGLNWMLVSQAMAWLPLKLSDLDDSARALFEQEFQDVSDYCLSLAPTDSDEDSNRTVPTELNTWWLMRIATLSMELDPDAAERWWKPIMELGIGAHYWVDSFVAGWFLEGAKSAPTPEEFARRWRPLMEYALSAPAWQKQGYRDYRRCTTLCEVMGLRSGARVVGELSYASVVASLKDHYKQWAALWLQEKEAANVFAAFLVQPSASAIVPSGIIWLSDTAVHFSDYDWREQGLADNLVTVLQRGWKNHRSKIVMAGPLKDAFFSLLSMLVKRQNDAAIVLQRDVGNII